MARLNRALAKAGLRRTCQKRMVLATIALAGKALMGKLWDGLVVAYLFSFFTKLRQLRLCSAPTVRRPIDFLGGEVGDFDFKELFRFHKQDFVRLATALCLPQDVRLPKGGSRSGLLCFAYTLWRAAYPSTLLKDELVWGESRGTLCEMFNVTIAWLYDTWAKHLVHDLNIDAVRPLCRHFATAIAANGAPLDRCWGFIDGTIRPTCRPVRGQREAYNGWKKRHGVKYQSIETPDGIMRQVWGPLLCRRNDNYLLAASDLLAQLQQHFNSADGTPWYLYGDPAYPRNPWMLRPYKGNLQPQERAFNRSMSRVRETVEWGFAKVVANWGFVDFEKQQKILGSACGVGQQYCVASLLTNCHTCLYGSQVSSYFNCSPPALEAYINGKG
jgi:nuclease HARBI1